MKIQYYPYSLVPRGALNSLQNSNNTTPREGALFKVVWQDGLVGYSSLHPWTELGDESLEIQLKNLKQGIVGAQVEQSIWLASRDAKLRQQKKHIFDVGAKVSNNYLLADYKSAPDGFTDEIKALNFSTVKLKVGTNLAEEADFVCRLAASKLKVRLDFNGIASLRSFERFVGRLTPLAIESIEYVEDPFRFDVQQWHEGSKLLPLAIDQFLPQYQWVDGEQPPFQVIVLKPAKSDVDKTVAKAIQHRLKLTVTSYMDHPVGVMHALGVAMKLQKDYPSMMLEAGCMTQNLYNLDIFSALVNTQGPFFLKTDGYGVGFDSLLEKIPWQNL